MEGLMRTWVSQLERAPRNLENFSNSPERQHLIFTTASELTIFGFSFHVKSLSHVITLFCCGNLSWPPGLDPKFQEKEANWGKR